MAKKSSFAVLGLGKFGSTIVEELVKLGKDVIAIDRDETQTKRLSGILPTVFIADATDEEALIELGLKDVKTAIVAFGNNVEASILTTVLLKDLGVEHIITRVDDEHYSRIVKKIGADEVITPQLTAGISIANRLNNSEDVVDYYKLAGKYSILQIKVSEKFVATKLKDLRLRKLYGVNIVLITRGKKDFVPDGDDSLLPKDIVHVVGTEKELSGFNDFINPKK